MRNVLIFGFGDVKIEIYLLVTVVKRTLRVGKAKRNSWEERRSKITGGGRKKDKS